MSWAFVKSFQAISRARAFNSLKSRVFVCLLQIRLRFRLTCCTFDRLENSLVRAAHHRPEKGNKISLLTSLHPSSSCCCCFFYWRYSLALFFSLHSLHSPRLKPTDNNRLWAKTDTKTFWCCLTMIKSPSQKKKRVGDPPTTQQQRPLSSSFCSPRVYIQSSCLNLRIFFEWWTVSVLGLEANCCVHTIITTTCCLPSLFLHSPHSRESKLHNCGASRKISSWDYLFEWVRITNKSTEAKIIRKSLIFVFYGGSSFTRIANWPASFLQHLFSLNLKISLVFFLCTGFWHCRLATRDFKLFLLAFICVRDSLVSFLWFGFTFFSRFAQ